MQIINNIESLVFYKNAVVAIGSFDGVHTAHQRLLQQVTSIAKAVNGTSVVVTFSPHPRTVVDPDYPFQFINTPDERNALLEKAGIDILLVFSFTKVFSQKSNSDFIKLLIRNINIHTVVIGYNHNFGKNREGNIDTLRFFSETYRFQIVEIEKQWLGEQAVNSTTIRKLVREGKIEQANAMLGYAYFAEIVVLQKEINNKQLQIKPSDDKKVFPLSGNYSICIAQHAAKLYIGKDITTIIFSEKVNDIKQNQKYNLYFI